MRGSGRTRRTRSAGRSWLSTIGPRRRGVIRYSFTGRKDMLCVSELLFYREYKEK